MYMLYLCSTITYHKRRSYWMFWFRVCSMCFCVSFTTPAPRPWWSSPASPFSCRPWTSGPSSFDTTSNASLGHINSCLSPYLRLRRFMNTNNEHESSEIKWQKRRDNVAMIHMNSNLSHTLFMAHAHRSQSNHICSIFNFSSHDHMGGSSLFSNTCLMSLNYTW